MAKPKTEPWFSDAASLMVRNTLSLRHAVSELGLEGITSDECALIEKRPSFQRILRAERLRLGQEVADDPLNTKEAAIGLMMQLVIKLMDAGDYDKAIEGLMKMAKVRGWMGIEGQVNVFGGLTAEDFKKLREELGGQTRGSKGATSATSIN